MFPLYSVVSGCWNNISNTDIDISRRQPDFDQLKKKPTNHLRRFDELIFEIKDNWIKCKVSPFISDRQPTWENNFSVFSASSVMSKENRGQASKTTSGERDKCDALVCGAGVGDYWTKTSSG